MQTFHQRNFNENFQIPPTTRWKPFGLSSHERRYYIYVTDSETHFSTLNDCHPIFVFHSDMIFWQSCYFKIQIVKKNCFASSFQFLIPIDNIAILLFMYSWRSFWLCLASFHLVCQSETLSCHPCLYNTKTPSPCLVSPLRFTSLIFCCPDSIFTLIFSGLPQVRQYPTLNMPLANTGLLTSNS